MLADVCGGGRVAHAWGACAHSANLADRKRGLFQPRALTIPKLSMDRALGAHWEQKRAVSLPKVNIVRGLGLVKKLGGEFTSTFREGFRATVTALAVITTGHRSQA